MLDFVMAVGFKLKETKSNSKKSNSVTSTNNYTCGSVGVDKKWEMGFTLPWLVFGVVVE